MNPLFKIAALLLGQHARRATGAGWRQAAASMGEQFQQRGGTDGRQRNHQQQEQEQPHQRTRAEAPEPADVGIVLALPIEARPLLAKLREPRTYKTPQLTIEEGLLGEKLVVTTLSGPGRARAERAARLLLEGHRPRWMISAGFAGALNPSFRRGDVLLAQEVVEPSGEATVIDFQLGSDAARQRFFAGRLITLDEIVRTAQEKSALRFRTHGDAVDMETSAIARLCQERSCRFFSVRVVSDDAHKDLPPEVLTILGPSGGFRVGATMGSLWRRPSCVMDLLELRESAHKAADRLAVVLEGLIAQLA